MANKTFEVDIGGKTYEVDAPDASTAWAWANQSVSAKQQPLEVIDPTEGMSGTEKFLAGTGKAFADIGRGVGQIGRNILPESIANRLDLPTQADIDQAKRRDEALMRTGAGFAGNIAGNVAATAPAMFIPGVNTVVGGAATGAGLGALQPVSTGESRGANAMIGGAFGGAVPAIAGGYRSLRALTDPLANQERVIGGALTRGIGQENAHQVAQALRGQGARTPGVTLSAGTVSENEALSAIEDAVRSQVPGGELSRQAQVNRTALAGALRDIGQDETALLAAKQAREQVAEGFYNQAKPNFVMPTPELQEILKTPAMKDAWKRAQRIAENEGKRITLGTSKPEQTITRTNPLTLAPEKVVIPAETQQISMEGLHYLKMGVDDLMNDVSSGIGKTEKRAITGLKDRFLKEVDQLSPEYQAGREAFSSMSAPIGQMQVGQRLYQTLVPATAGENPAALNYNALAKALRNPDVVAQQATGFSGARMGKIMSPEQLQSIQGVTSDASRIGEAIRRGAGTGSATARRLATTDLVSQHFTENAPFITRLMSVANLAGKVPLVNVAAKGASAAGGFLGGKLNQAMVGKMDELLAGNPAQVAKMIEDELARLSPKEKTAAIRALQNIPQLMMLSIPSMER